MFEIPPSASKLMQEYTGETNWGAQMDKMEARERGDGSHLQFTNQNCDTSLFPYQAEGPLPAPIPTPVEIAAARPADVEKGIWRVGPYMVKSGSNVEIFQEAENMLYLERNSTVRTAKVYAAFTSAELDPWPVEDTNTGNGTDNQTLYYYLVTEFIEGITLSDFCDDTRTIHMNVVYKIGNMLGEQLRRLRSVPPQDVCFGRINSRPFMRFTPVSKPLDPDSKDWGPFNYEDFVTRVMHSSKICYALPHEVEIDPVTRMLFRDAKYTLLDIARPSDRVPVLGHLDPSNHNVLVEFIYDEEGKPIDVVKVVLIDWEFMAWVPPWFEAGDLCAGGYRGCDNSRVAWKEAFGKMGKVNMSLVALWGLGLARGDFRCGHI